MAKIYEEVQKNITEWKNFIKEKFGNQAELISVSRYDECRRIYKLKNRIIKIHKITTKIKDRSNNLNGEYLILKDLNNISGVCQNPEYYKESGWEFLMYDYIEGESLENLLMEESFKRDKIILKKIFKIILSLNKKGIAHRDIKPDNIILSNDGSVSIIDFDQSVRTSFLHAFLIDICGIGNTQKMGRLCFERLIEVYKKEKSFLLRLFFLIPRIIQKINRFFVVNAKKQKYIKNEDNDINDLKEAWKIAEKSEANSPGGNVSYYSLGTEEFHLYGERPWSLRWEKISETLDFKGKNILECGCNLGLLSAFAKRSGANNCVGVDWKKDILDGARLVSRSMHVDNKFMQINFDSDEKWEEKISGFDMVIALSIVHWLKNPDRFMAFLGKHNEILYEGHDSVEIETKRLKNAGFNVVNLIFMSERSRAIFYAHK